MTNHEFICWINGYLTLSDDSHIDKQQFTIIKNHANLVTAIDGKLTTTLQDFLATLESTITTQGTIPITTAQELAKSFPQ